MVKHVVYIVGAGFSRALSEHMPLTDELGNECMKLAPGLFNTDAPRFSGGNFESWLSRKAEEQPYLRPSDNLESRSIYSRVVDLIARIMRDRELQALADPAPEWFLDLVNLWHLERATVITFNYDVLVEVAIARLRLYDEESDVAVPWATAINFTPSGMGGASYGEQGQTAKWQTMQLLKMHGSSNWYWSTGDSSAATMTRARLPGQFGAPSPLTEFERQRWLPGREPFLVPPASAKSSYYGNPITREVWRQAYEALRGASEVVVMGYSLPVTDVATSSLMIDGLQGARDVVVRVVDLHAQPVVERFVSLGAGIRPEAETSSATAIATFASRRFAQVVSDRGETVKQVLRDAESSMPVVVAWDSPDFATVLSAESSSGACELRVEVVGQSWFSTRLDRSSRREIEGHSPDAPLTVGELRAASGGSVALEVALGSGARLPVVGARVRDFTSVNGGQGVWMQLTTARADRADIPD